jgi:hypothetical protein
MPMQYRSIHDLTYTNIAKNNEYFILYVIKQNIAHNALHCITCNTAVKYYTYITYYDYRPEVPILTHIAQ